MADSQFKHPSDSCLRLLTHWARRAASRAACTAGNNNEIKMPMMAITTKSSTSVKPRTDCDDLMSMDSLNKVNEETERSKLRNTRSHTH